jgi:hypothetical protein
MTLEGDPEILEGDLVGAVNRSEIGLSLLSQKGDVLASLSATINGTDLVGSMKLTSEDVQGHWSGTWSADAPIISTDWISPPDDIPAVVDVDGDEEFSFEPAWIRLMPAQDTPESAVGLFAGESSDSCSSNDYLVNPTTPGGLQNEPEIAINRASIDRLTAGSNDYSLGLKPRLLSFVRRGRYLACLRCSPGIGAV